MIESVFDETKESMGKSISALQNELKRVRTGRASLSILDGIRVITTELPLRLIR